MADGERFELRKLTYHLPEPIRFGSLVFRRRHLWVKAGVIFIHVPRNGGTSINTALYGRFMGHYSARDVRIWAPDLFGRLPSFAVTRNPWARLLSAYRFARAGRAIDGPAGVGIRHPERYQAPVFGSFERFVVEWLPERDLSKEDLVFRLQSGFVLERDGEVLVSHLGRLEALSELETYLTRTLGRPLKIGHINRTGDILPYRMAYTAEMRDIVARAYGQDVEAFGYEF